MVLHYHYFLLHSPQFPVMLVIACVFQGLYVLGLWGIKCHDTVCLETQSTPLLVWSRMAKVLVCSSETGSVLDREVHCKLVFAALKVHISDEFKDILSSLGGYNIVERGETLLKV